MYQTWIDHLTLISVRCLFTIFSPRCCSFSHCHSSDRLPSEPLGSGLWQLLQLLWTLWRRYWQLHRWLRARQDGEHLSGRWVWLYDLCKCDSEIFSETRSDLECIVSVPDLINVIHVAPILPQQTAQAPIGGRIVPATATAWDLVIISLASVSSVDASQAREAHLV